MKKLLILIILFTYILFSITSCTSKTDEVIKKVDIVRLNIMATTFPQYEFAKKIVGNRADVTLLLSPGIETHSYEPSPQDIIAIANCDVFIYTGGETWVSQILETTNTDNIKLINLMEIVLLLKEEITEGIEHKHKDEDQNEIEYDEHIWMSPKNAMSIIHYLSYEFSKLQIENTDYFSSNAYNYIVKLDELDQLFKSIVDNANNNIIIVADRFPFKYLTEEYGIQYYAAFSGCSTQTDPSSTTIAFLIDQANNNSIPVIFYTEQSNQKMADIICESSNSEKKLLHSCHNITQKEIDNGVSYISLMTQNAKNLKEALE